MANRTLSTNRGDDRFGRASAETLNACDLPFEALTPAEAASRWPQISFHDISSVLYEPEAGYLLSRKACEQVANQVVAAGAEYVQTAAAAPARFDSAGRRVSLEGGGSVDADAFVFACGPWLGHLFPELLRGLITPTRQEVHYFGTPAADACFKDERLPVWIDFGQRCIYGIPAAAGRAFKVADDTPGPVIDPTADDRMPTETSIATARRLLGKRFPLLAAAPLVGSEVCQYESTPDANFIIDRHPEMSSVWIVGGGSGHGFKMGPVIGETAASLVLGELQPDSCFSLRRFAMPPAGGWQPKWS
jgi:sarcosine oxidase